MAATGSPACRQACIHMAAVVSLDPRDLDDPAFLDQLVPASLKITLNAGSPALQHLQLTK
jgi:hypothetical protein